MDAQQYRGCGDVEVRVAHLWLLMRLILLIGIGHFRHHTKSAGERLPKICLPGMKNNTQKCVLKGITMIIILIGASENLMTTNQLLPGSVLSALLLCPQTGKGTGA